MTTLDFISRSEVLRAPPKYHLEMRINASHGSSFNVGIEYGIEKMPFSAASARIAIGMMVFESRKDNHKWPKLPSVQNEHARRVTSCLGIKNTPKVYLRRSTLKIEFHQKGHVKWG